MTLDAPQRILMDMVLHHCYQSWAIHCQKCLTSDDCNPYTRRIYNNHLLPGPHCQYVAEEVKCSIKRITNDEWPQYRRQNLNSLHQKNVMSWTITTQSELYGVRSTPRVCDIVDSIETWNVGDRSWDSAAWTTWRLGPQVQDLVQILLLGRSPKQIKIERINTKHWPLYGHLSINGRPVQ